MASRSRMTPEEAARIRAQAAAGRLDHDDPEVRRVLDEANRTSVRAHVYGLIAWVGATGETRRRRLLNMARTVDWDS